MTGEELIDFIRENKLENYEILVYDHYGAECYLEYPEFNEVRKEIYIEG